MGVTLAPNAHVILPLSVSLVDWCADHLIAEHEEMSRAAPDRSTNPADFSSIAVVFPGRRPALYLRRALGQVLKQSYHPPAVFDIDELMAFVATHATGNSGQDRRHASQIELLRLLYKLSRSIKSQGSGTPARANVLNDLPIETFDSFFFWGLRLLEVFEELATELITPSDLAQASALALSEAGLSLEVRGLWPVLPELYERWQEALASHGLWTRGERYREADLTIDHIDWPFARTYFAGFVALNRAEASLFRSLTRRGLATVIIQEGGKALTGRDEIWEPLIRLRSVCHGAWRHENAIDLSRPRIFLHQGFDTHSQLHLARHIVRQWPQRVEDLSPGAEALVLPRPDPLLPVLSWVVDDAARPYNISMGYPLQRTSAAQLIDFLFEAQEGRLSERYYVPHYLAVLRHPYIKNLVHPLDALLWDEGRSFVSLEDLETHAKDSEPLALETLCRIHDLCFRAFEHARSLETVAVALESLFSTLIEESSAGRHPLAADFLGTLLRLLEEIRLPFPGATEAEFPHPWPLEESRQGNSFTIIRYLVRQTRIPFTGIPIEGLQVLGFLETRCLRFDRMLILDVNEGILPPEPGPDAILPFGLRRHLGLPDHRSRTLLARYYFHRLLAGSKEAHLVYSEGKGQMRSRFVEELVWAAEKEARQLEVLSVERPLYGSTAPNRASTAVGKSPEVARYLAEFVFSASSLDTYVSCPMRFYGRHVLGFFDEPVRTVGDIDPARVGSLVHRILQSFYQTWVGGEIRFGPKEEERLEETIRLVLVKAFGRLDQWSGAVDLFREILIYRLGHFLRLDREISEGHHLIGTELSCEAGFPVDDRAVRLKGIWDRVESDGDGRIRVMDYKTGSGVSLPQTTLDRPYEDRFLIGRNIVSFQLPLYLYLFRQAHHPELAWSNMDAILCSLQGLTDKSSFGHCYHHLFSNRSDGAPSRADIMDRCFLPSLEALLREIQDPARPFVAEPLDPRHCEYCSFQGGLCQAG